MKEFKDLEFEENSQLIGIQAKMKFENGWGVSVIKSKWSYGGDEGLYEMAVLDKDGYISYNSGVIADVAGYLTEEMVTEFMRKVQEL